MIDATKLIAELDKKIGIRQGHSQYKVVMALEDFKEAVINAMSSAPSDSLAEMPVELPQGFPRTIEDAVKQSAVVGATKEEIEAVWNMAVSRGGLDARGQAIRSWPHYMAMNKGYNQSRRAEQAATAGNAAVKDTPWNLKTQLEAIEKKMAELKNVGGHEDAMGFHWNPMKPKHLREGYIKLKTKRDGLRDRMSKL